MFLSLIATIQKIRFLKRTAKVGKKMKQPKGNLINFMKKNSFTSPRPSPQREGARTSFKSGKNYGANICILYFFIFEST